jgi:NAD(P)H-dependent flavin oxidoreductase YrpB (nitropropane dioxygenase family)
MQYPVFGFTHCREVVVAISRSGGMGVFGAAYFSPVQVEDDVAWIQEQLGDHPFGVDVMIPRLSHDSGDSDLETLEGELRAKIPDRNVEFVEELLDRFEVPSIPEGLSGHDVYPLGPSAAAAHQHIDSAVAHGASLIVSALGTPPADAVAFAHERGVKVGAMVGAARHAQLQLDAGVDLIIAQGSEAAAHAGDITTMVLVPEIVDQVAPCPVLAAGGIATGRQVLAARALGAQGVWMGSLWRTATENTEPAGVIDLLLAAGAGDTVRSRCMTGKELRQLSSPWNQAWAAPDAPRALPMPLQRMLTAEAEQRIEYHRRWELVVSPIGQVVGQLRGRRSTAEIIQDLVDGYQQALGTLL